MNRDWLPFLEDLSRQPVECWDRKGRGLPDHDKREERLAERQAQIAESLLDQMDADEPVWHVRARVGGPAWHAEWAQHRRAFITTGNTGSLAQMTEYVTGDNPQLASRPAPQRKWPAGKIIVVGYAAFAVTALLVLITLGALGIVH